MPASARPGARRLAAADLALYRTKETGRDCALGPADDGGPAGGRAGARPPPGGRRTAGELGHGAARAASTVLSGVAMPGAIRQTEPEPRRTGPEPDAYRLASVSCQVP